MISGLLRDLQTVSFLLVLVSLVSFPSLASASSNVDSVGSNKLSEAILGARAAAESSATATASASASATTKPLSPLDVKYQNNNIALLPAQICGIIGAYLLTVVVIGVCLLTFGRRMRRDAQYGSGQLEVEMVKTPKRPYDPSLPSPASTKKNWMRKAFGKDTRSGSTSTTGNISAPVSPGMPGHYSLDQKVVASNREQQQRDLEMLYQAVMEQDAAKTSTTNVTTTAVDPDEDGDPEQPFSPMSPQFPGSPLSPPPNQLPPVEYTSQSKPVDKRILSIRTGRERTVPSDMKSPLSPHSPANPLSPGPVKAIFPPDSPASYGPQAPYSPMHAQRPAPMPQGGLPASPRSFTSRDSRGDSMGSNQSLSNHKVDSKTRKALRNLRISSPIQRVEDDEERVPLSPRNYGQPGPPPELPTPHTGKSFASVTTTRTFITQDSDEEEEYAHMQREALEQPGPLPRAAPQRGYGHPSNYELRNQPSDPSLPFRNLHPDQAVPATPVKTTVLDAKTKASMRGPRTGGLTPMTGTVPMTPYSPYMPYTPITPVTPHLMNKREIKAVKKEERRRVLAKDEGDLVESDKSMWGDAY